MPCSNEGKNMQGNEGLNLVYIQNANLPTEWAHGYQIVKTCQALAKVGAKVSLVLPRRINHERKRGLYEYYGIERSFETFWLPVIDLLSYVPFALEKVPYLIERWTFLKSLARYLRALPPDAVCYTRDPIIAIEIKKIRPNLRVFLELHALPNPSTLSRLGSIDGFVALTSWIRKRVLEQFPGSNATVVPDAVDLGIFDPPLSKDEARRRLSIPIEETAVVYGGRFATMEQGKGLSSLDEAVFSLKDQFPKIHLYLVGGGYEEFIRVEGRAPHTSTTCIPPVKRDILATYYRAAAALAMPFPNTPHYAYEMSPMKMFEYMASGTPIITSDLPSVRDVLDENMAILYPPDDEDRLRDALEKFLELDDEARNRMARAAKKVVIEKYTWGARAKNISDFIRAA